MMGVRLPTVLAVTLVAIVTCCSAQDACRGVPTDVIFLLDASMQANADFQSALSFVENVTAHFAVGVYDTKVALVKFSIYYRKIFTLATYKTRDGVLGAIRHVNRTGGLTITNSDLGDALSLTKTQLTRTSNGRRLGARLVVVVVTSKTDSIPASVRVNAQAIKDQGATIYAIGVGPLVTDADLTTVASDDQRKFAVADFGDLAALQDTIVNDICPPHTGSTSAPGINYTVNDCPAGIPRDSNLQVHNGLCYEFVVYRQKDFWESEKDCASRGGHLVTINDQATNIYILTELEHVYHIQSAVWIGLHDSKSEGKFVWTDGTDAGFTNFGTSGNHIENDCIAMDPNPNSNAGIWIQYHCIEGTWTKPIQHMYVCQYNPVGPTTIAPTTMAPTTMEPSTISPTTMAPTTMEPTTMEPTTMEPTAMEPTTMEPTAMEPTTIAPTTMAPTTMEPTTIAPTTMEPTTIAPTTMAPTTMEPTTVAATTMAPTTMEPTTVATTTIALTTISPTTSTTAPATMGQTTTTPLATLPTTSPDIQVCPPFSCGTDCGLDGYKLDGEGCQLCECDTIQVCSPFSCGTDCGLDGYKLDGEGCQLCECDTIPKK